MTSGNHVYFYGKKVVSEIKKEFIMKCWASIYTKLIALTVDRVSSIQDDVEVILNDMSRMGVGISPLKNLLGYFFELVTFYDQARSTLLIKLQLLKSQS